MQDSAHFIGVAVEDEARRRCIEHLVRSELDGSDPRWIAQRFSPIGPRRHVAAVRRRFEEAIAERRLPIGAAIVGRRFLLTPESLAEEVGRMRAAGTLRRLRSSPSGKRFLEYLERSYAASLLLETPPAPDNEVS